MSLIVNAEPDDRLERVTLTDAQKRRQRARSVAIGLALAALVALFYVVTIVKLGSNVATAPM
jgi:ferric-dicitrate binding protein FerR (iron transport regulator)